MEMYKTKAFAKINITLDVINKRCDGYHDLEMIMQTISLNDEVTVKRNSSGDIRLFSKGVNIPRDNKNLAWRAAEAVKKAYKISDGVDIEIQKKIPVAAGLAGGSSDCAAVIRGMREIFMPEEPIDSFYGIASSLGKDVPFCIEGGTVFAFGLGDKFKRLKDIPHFYVAVAKPNIYVSTAEVYKALKIEDIKKHPNTKAVIDCIDAGDKNGIISGVLNVLENVTANKYPVIETIKNLMLKNGAVSSAMSGSGPSVFGLFNNRERAEKAVCGVRDILGIKEVFLAETLSPQAFREEF